MLSTGLHFASESTQRIIPSSPSEPIFRYRTRTNRIDRVFVEHRFDGRPRASKIPEDVSALLRSRPRWR